MNEEEQEEQRIKDEKTAAMLKAIMSSQFPDTSDFSGILESIEGNV